MKTVDASNAFGSIKIKKIVEGCEKVPPWLVSQAVNICREKLWIKINSDTHCFFKLCSKTCSTYICTK